MNAAVIRGAYELPYQRRTSRSTVDLLAAAFSGLLSAHGMTADDVDGLGVASFTLRPDRCIDLAWNLGLAVGWCMDDGLGGASGINLLQHAVAAIEAGHARNVVLLAGDAFRPEDFADLQANYNRTTRTLMHPLGIARPNELFALLTQRHMAANGLDRTDYGELVLAQRRNAARNPGAVYRGALTMAEYLAATPVADPLVVYDCVPVVAGANALLLGRADDHPKAAGVRVRAVGGLHNPDHQHGDGLSTGLRRIAGQLFAQAGIAPADIDVISVYDDYPVMTLVQLEDLGLIPPGGARHFLRDVLPSGRVALNTSGGQLSAGQAGIAGGMHGLTEVVRQLSGQCADRQVPDARWGVVAGYGMVQYRYGMCANAAILEAVR